MIKEFRNKILFKNGEQTRKLNAIAVKRNNLKVLKILSRSFSYLKSSIKKRGIVKAI